MKISNDDVNQFFQSLINDSKYMKILEERHDHLKERKYIVTCEKCHSKLEYIDADICIYFSDFSRPNINYVKCPICNNYINHRYENIVY